MPTVTPTIDSAHSRVRLDIDFTDTDAPYCLVQRLDAATNAPTAVRTHGQTTTVGSAAYSNLYAGYRAVLYDTECPLDTAVYYTASSVQAALNVNQTFEGGYVEPWLAQQTTVTVTAYYNTVLDAGVGSWFLSFHGDGSTATPQVRSEPCAATQGATLTASVRLSIPNGQAYSVGIQFLDSAQAILSTATNSFTGTGTVATVTTAGTAPANTVYARVFVQLTGTPASTVVGYISQAYLYAATASATSTAVLLPSLGACWLKDPLQPANNVRVDLCFDPNPLCVPQEGVFFQSLDVETMPANSASFNVNNQPEPIVVSKVRSSDTSTLTLVSRTFADRDRLRALLAPGTPLLWQVPDEYGSPDRYLSVGNATISRVLPDHRFPIRVLGLPFVVTRAPGGPSSGVAGARWQDSCNQYASWGAVNAAGKTWLNVLDGGIG